MANIFDQVYQDLVEQQMAAGGDWQANAAAQPSSYPMRPEAWQDTQRRSAQYGAGEEPSVPLENINIPQGDGAAPPLAAYQANTAPKAAGPLSAAQKPGMMNIEQMLQLAQQQARQKQEAGQAYLQQMEQQYQQQAGLTGPSKWEQAAALLQVAGALGQPTRSGSLFESLGAAGTAAAGPLQKMGEAEQKRRDALNQLQLARAKMAYDMAGVGSPDIDTMTKLAQLQIAQQRQAQAEKEEPTFREVKLPGMDPFTAKVVGGNLFTLDGRPIDPAALQQEAMRSGIEGQRAQGAALGIPPPRTDFIRTLPPKEQAKARLKVVADQTKLLDKEEKDLTSVENDIRELQEFMDLNRQSMLSGPVGGRAPAMSAEASRMDSISANQSRKMRQPGEGATSDFDARMFLKGTVSREKPLAANEAIAAGAIMAKKNQLEYLEFKRAYLEQNQTLENARDYWKAYLQANPIFDPRSVTRTASGEDTSNLRVNQARKPWREWFKEQMGGAGERQGAAPSGVTREDVLRELARRRRQQQQGSGE